MVSDSNNEQFDLEWIEMALRYAYCIELSRKSDSNLKRHRIPLPPKLSDAEVQVRLREIVCEIENRYNA